MWRKTKESFGHIDTARDQDFQERQIGKGKGSLLSSSKNAPQQINRCDSILKLRRLQHYQG
jgi:hypothetical protein